MCSTGRPMKCQQCPKTFYDMKSLQIHNFIDHHKPSTVSSPSVSSPQHSSRAPVSNPFPTGLNFNRQASPPAPQNVVLPQSLVIVPPANHLVTPSVTVMSLPVLPPPPPSL